MAHEDLFRSCVCKWDQGSMVYFIHCSFEKKNKKKKTYVYGCLTRMYVNVPHVGLVLTQTRRRVLDTLELELQITVSGHVGVGN